MKLLWGVVLSTLFALVTSQACSDVTIENLELAEVDANLVVSWTAGANAAGCQFEIFISSNVESDTILQYLTTESSIVVENVVPCSEVVVAVSTDGGPISTATAVISMRATTAPILREMITSCNSIQMIWDAEPFEQNMCQVTHFQMFCLSDTHNFTIPQMVTDVHHRTFDILITVLQPDIYYTCNGFIFTTLAGFSPPSSNIEFWSNLDSVRDLEVAETEQSILATWEAPLNSEECGVAYDVTYDNEVLGSTTVEVVGLEHYFDIELIPCTNYDITVAPISFTGSKGTSVTKEFIPSVRVGVVSALQVNDAGDSIVLSWDAANVGRCAVSYIVQYSIQGVLQDTITTTDTALTFNRVPCAQSEFTVQAVSEGVLGVVTSSSIELGVADITSISEVQNLVFNDNLLTWEPPVTVGLCEISYTITILDHFGVTEIITDSPSLIPTLVPCSVNVFMVAGVSNELVGPTSVWQVVAPIAEQSPPVHVSTIPNFTAAAITLQGQAISENLCVIHSAILECSNDNADSFERSIDVADNSPRLFTVFLDELELDTIYTCVARLDNSAVGNEFSFRTVPLVQRELEISAITEESFVVSWAEDYGRDFVIGYTLSVESLGPDHRVPDGCPIDTSVFTFGVPNTDLSHAFVQGLPNYLYRVTLITAYTLGIQRDSNSPVPQTLPGEPAAPENLAVSWVSNSDQEFDVSAVLSWASPCDLNGSLRGFGVNVTASFQLAGTSQSVTANLAVVADEDAVNDPFIKTIADINPFFTYEVSVNVAAAVEGPSVSLTLEPPGACACVAP